MTNEQNNSQNQNQIQDPEIAYLLDSVATLKTLSKIYERLVKLQKTKLFLSVVSEEEKLEDQLCVDFVKSTHFDLLQSTLSHPRAKEVEELQTKEQKDEKTN